MSGDFLAPQRGYGRLRMLGAAFLVLAAGGALLWVNRPGAGTDGIVAKRASSPSTAAAVLSPSAVAPVEPLRLVRGSRTVDGVQVGFPRSTAGAVSAAIEYWTALGATLEPSRARDIGERIAVRSWTTAGDDLAAGPQRTRRQLGLPADGELPAGTSVSLGPVAYQLRDAADQRTTVLLLAYLISTTPTAGTQNRLGVFPAPLQWDDGDWRITRASSAADYQSLVAAPGSAQAAAAGWLDFVQ